MDKQIDVARKGQTHATQSEQDRRSSIRVRSLLECAVRPLSADEVLALEAKILDTAVMESDGIMQDVADWADRTEDVPRHILCLLNEMRAIRQQLTDIQRVIETQGDNPTKPRWMEVNDQGIWMPLVAGDPVYNIGDMVEIRLHIPSSDAPVILALGEVIRLTRRDNEDGTAVRFHVISNLHQKAIVRYALRRERQAARTALLSAEK